MKQPVFEGSITDVHGIRVGQAQNAAAKTGVTVILASHDGAVVGADVRGAAPARARRTCARRKTPWSVPTPWCWRAAARLAWRPPRA